MWVYSISPPSLSLIGPLTTEFFYRTETETNTQIYIKTETDTLHIYQIGSSKKKLKSTIGKLTKNYEERMDIASL